MKIGEEIIPAAAVAWDGAGANGKRPVCQGVVCGAWDHGAYVLLPAPAAAVRSLSGIAGSADNAAQQEATQIKGNLLSI